MSKKLLDGAQVYAGLQQVCGELVAEFVGGCGGQHPHLLPGGFDGPLERPGGQSFSASPLENGGRG